MPRRRFLLTLGFFLWAWAAGEAAAQPALKVLFIGNSYTFVNDLPSLVVALADAAGGRRIEADQFLVGGYTFQQHVKEGKAIEKIRAKRWDVVVLQEQSLTPLIDRGSMEKYARILHKEIKKRGAKTVFYLTWARQNIPQMQAGADPAKSPAYVKAVYRLLDEPKPASFENWWKPQARGLAGGLNGAYFDLAGECGAKLRRSVWRGRRRWKPSRPRLFTSPTRAIPRRRAPIWRPASSSPHSWTRAPWACRPNSRRANVCLPTSPPTKQNGFNRSLGRRFKRQSGDERKVAFPKAPRLQSRGTFVDLLPRGRRHHRLNVGQLGVDRDIAAGMENKTLRPKSFHQPAAVLVNLIRRAESQLGRGHVAHQAHMVAEYLLRLEQIRFAVGRT